MIKKILILILVFVIILMYVGGMVFESSPQQTARNMNNAPTTPPSSDQNLQTKEAVSGAVAVKVTPSSLSKGNKLSFKVVFDTHSVDLNYNLKNLAFLQDNNLKKYQPTSWTGGQGGHHVEGDLIFDSVIANDTKSVKLTLQKIEGKDLEFVFDIK